MSDSAATPRPPCPPRDQSWRQQPQHRPGVNAYARDRYQQQQAGRWAPFTATAPVREHVDQLGEAGMTAEQIARASGVSVSTLGRAFKVTRMSTVAADAILAVQPPPPAPNPGPDPTRQLQALVADGWNLTQIAEAAGISDRTAWQTVHRHTTPTRRTIDAVDALYEELKFEDPGDGAAAVRSRLHAERQGWTNTAPDGQIDAKDFVDEVAVDRAVLGDPSSGQAPLRRQEQQAALRRLAGTLADDEIGRRLGLATRTVLRHRVSQGLPAYAAVPNTEGPAR
ncbi:MAG: helix-turn-helix domain-containing protein [Lapillicoccus sp.]